MEFPHPMGITNHIVSSDGTPLHVRVEGEGAPLILLHGFPDDGSLWDQVVPLLVANGWRVVVPDLRGFGKSGRASTPDGYRLQRSIEDVTEVAWACDALSAPIIGHDWGALIAWHVAASKRMDVPWLASLAVPHPDTFLTCPIEQRRRSWYAFLFNLPVAAHALTGSDWALFREWAGEGGMPSHIVDERIEAFSDPSTLQAALAWYRVNLPIPPAGRVDCPALIVHGADDPYVLDGVMRASADHVSAMCEFVTLPGGHWIPLSAAPAVAELICDFANRAKE